jgi:hypothetical protein
LRFLQLAAQAQSLAVVDLRIDALAHAPCALVQNDGISEVLHHRVAGDIVQAHVCEHSSGERLGLEVADLFSDRQGVLRRKRRCVTIALCP